VRQVAYLQELNRDAQSAKHKIQQNIRSIAGVYLYMYLVEACIVIY